MNFTDLTKKVRKVPNVRVLSVCTLILLRHKEVSSYSEVLYNHEPTEEIKENKTT